MNALKRFKEQLREMAGISAVSIKKADDHVSYSKECSVTGDLYCVIISREEYDDITLNGKLTQDVLAHRSLDEIEFIISGTTPKEWEQL
jgi:hypothetical protein